MGFAARLSSGMSIGNWEVCAGAVLGELGVS